MRTAERAPSMRLWPLLLLAAVTSACGSKVSDELPGGESHFLAKCDNGCGALSCIDKRCTRECEEASDCSGLAANAVCAATESGAVCDVKTAAPCTEGGLSYALGETWRCSDGCNTCTCGEDGVQTTLIGCSVDGGVTCQEGGNTYQLNDTWQCSDGCNTCTCTPDGVASTAIGCGDPPTDCSEGGVTHELGDSWTCSDGCNTCTCTIDGVASTEIGCGDPPADCTEGGVGHALGDSWACSDGCNTCTCTEQGIATTMVECQPACVEGGVAHQPGETWECSDGCNTCSCDDDGNVSTTDIACPTVTCDYEGQTYQAGDVVELSPGVTCLCRDDGTVGFCTGVILDGGAVPADGGSLCDLPADPGDCDAAFPAVYFDRETGECLPFTWGGCGGNANRFDSNEACYAACRPDAG